MTREEALRKTKGYLTDIIPSDDYDEVEEIIKALEQEPKWIPVKEKPKENGWYQCSVDTPGGSEYVMDLFYKDGKWLDNRRINMFDTYSIFGYGSICEYHKLSFDEFDDFDWTRHVKAWMPLPKPYKAESEEV